MRRLLVLTLLLAAGLASSARAAGPQPPSCPLLGPSGPAVERSIDVGGGLSVVARDPYGPTLFRNSFEFDFSVRAPDAARARIADVSWALDGREVRRDPTAPYDWRGVSGSSRMPAGDHLLTVTVDRVDGSAPASASFAITASDCGPVSSFTEIGFRGSGGRFTSLYATSSLQSDDGPTMRAVSFESPDVSVHLRGLRGRAVGRLRVGKRDEVLRLGARGLGLLSARGISVALHPGERGYLTVSGLPSGTREVQLRFTGRAADLLRSRRVGPNRCRYVSSVRVSGPKGSLSAREGTTTGIC